MQRHSEEGGVHECAAEGVQLVVGLIGGGGAVTTNRKSPSECRSGWHVLVDVRCSRGDHDYGKREVLNVTHLDNPVSGHHSGNVGRPSFC